MIKFLKELFGLVPKINYAELVLAGAIVIDVRTRREFQEGHLKESINIPLKNLQEQLTKLNKSKPIITCCASGARSATAKSILKANGFSEVHNGGAWQRLQHKIS